MYMEKNTIKHKIEKYVMFKIVAEEWKKGETTPSETSLAKKFECSRLTVRNSLQTFVSMGILKPIKGVGYKIVGASGKLFNSISSMYNITSTKTEKVNNFDMNLMLASAEGMIQNKWGITDAESAKCFKKLFYKENELQVAQVSFLNKNAIWGIDDERLKNSLTKALALNGVIPNRIDQRILFANFPYLSQYYEKLGYSKELALIEVSEIGNEEGWIEFSIRIIKREKVDFQKSQMIIT